MWSITKRFLHKLKQKNFFNKNEYDQLHPSSSVPSLIYGTPKMHTFSSSDSFPKLCPIFSPISSFINNVARFLYDPLPLIVPNNYSCKDTFPFVSQTKNANLSRKCLVYFSVTTSFTNIPPQETIDTAINLIFNHILNLKITRREFKKLFPFASSQTHFFSPPLSVIPTLNTSLTNPDILFKIWLMTI